jgi:hypothetical protein
MMEMYQAGMNALSSQMESRIFFNIKAIELLLAQFGHRGATFSP